MISKQVSQNRAFSFEELLRQAHENDASDKLAFLRQEFELPPGKVYLCGNSLGPLPRRCRAVLNQELDKWSAQGVEGHFTEPNPWVTVNEVCVDSMARLVGAKPSEVAVMNSLTVNIHLLLTSFYIPQGRKRKVLIENNAFPSDSYAVFSHVKQRGFDPQTEVIQVDLSQLVSTIEKDHGETIALVFIGGVNYQTGEVVDMQRITELCHSYGIIVGFDLAHAAGNIPLKLNQWQVDFAAWCTYKYLNSGPGGIACAFVHSTHHKNSSLQRLEGWWGALKSTRFQMKDTFTPDEGASAWALSNPPVFQTMSLRASLDVFDKVKNLDDMFEKSRKLTAFMELCLHSLLVPGTWSLLTPRPPFRGCQLSIVFPSAPADKSFDIHSVHRMISDEYGFICDKREPNVLRVAPVPLFNSFKDVLEFASALRRVLDTLARNAKL